MDEISLVHKLVSPPSILCERLPTSEESTTLLGIDPCMADLFEIMLRVSRSHETVMILGETGTGKNLVAQSIHHLGRLRDKPFLPIDCCTLIPTLADTELFGHVRGAFTGAISDKKGLFEAAQDGTVFLDEIGEMELGAQSKLLRVIHEREVRPVGSTRWVKIGARIIVATNRDLAKEVQQGTFRKDLYFRLNVFTFTLPPLRQHKGDIPLLANYFLAKFSLGNRECPQLSANALDCLMAYDWPGNVRELENCMKRALAWGSGPLVHRQDLFPNVLIVGGAALPAAIGDEQIVSLREVERQAIVHALAVVNGDRLTAAKLLGIGKTTIYRKLSEYGIAQF